MAKKKSFQISNALTEGLEETIIAAHHYSGELRVDVIPLKKIELDPENPRDLLLSYDDLYNGLVKADPHYERKLTELESLQTIAHSIRDQGIINPVIVYKQGEKYRLIAGERRTLASILAGKSDIQAKILDAKPNELKVSLLQWIENIERADLTLWERLRNLEKIVSLHAAKKGITFEQVTVTELSQLIGCTKPHAMNYKAVLTADQQLKQQIAENKIRNLEKAAFISSIQSTDIKQSAMAACIAGHSLKQLKLMVEQEKSLVRERSHVKAAVKRGRQAVSVNFGATKNITVAKVIVDSILKNQAATEIAHVITDIDWNDYKAVTDTFKNVLKKLEELHA